MFVREVFRVDKRHRHVLYLLLVTANDYALVRERVHNATGKRRAAGRKLTWHHGGLSLSGPHHDTTNATAHAHRRNGEGSMRAISAEVLIYQRLINYPPHPHTPPFATPSRAKCTGGIRCSH